MRFFFSFWSSILITTSLAIRLDAASVNALVSVVPYDHPGRPIRNLCSHMMQHQHVLRVSHNCTARHRKCRVLCSVIIDAHCAIWRDNTMNKGDTLRSIPTLRIGVCSTFLDTQNAVRDATQKVCTKGKFVQQKYYCLSTVVCPVNDIKKSRVNHLGDITIPTQNSEYSLRVCGLHTASRTVKG
jgi:hypothetical protein